MGKLNVAPFGAQSAMDTGIHVGFQASAAFAFQNLTDDLLDFLGCQPAASLVDTDVTDLFFYFFCRFSHSFLLVILYQSLACLTAPNSDPMYPRVNGKKRL